MPYPQAHISVLIVSVSDKIFNYLQDLMTDMFYLDVHRASSIGEAKRMTVSDFYDIVIISAPLKDENGVDFAIDLSADTPAGILFLIASDYYEQISEELGDYGVLTVSKPTNRQILYESIRLAAATNARLKKYEQKNAKLTAKMEEIRIVNHAKWALIENLGLSEEEAHKLIEKQAMDARMSKKEIAETILKTY